LVPRYIAYDSNLLFSGGHCIVRLLPLGEE